MTGPAGESPATDERWKQERRHHNETEPTFSLAFLQAAHEAGFDAGVSEGLRLADEALQADFEAARAVVHSAAGGEPHGLFEELGIDPVSDPWAEVADRLERTREDRRTAVRESLRGGEVA